MKKTRLSPDNSPLNRLRNTLLNVKRSKVLSRFKVQDRFLLSMMYVVGLTSLLWLSSMLLSGDGSAWPDLLTLGAVLFVIALVLQLPFSVYDALRKLAFTGIVILAATTLARFAIHIIIDGDFVRVSLAFSSPVVLAASLLSCCLAYNTLNRQPIIRGVVSATVALAILMTASRMAFMALCAAWFVSLVIQRKWWFSGTALSLVVGVVGISFLYSQAYPADLSRNLLRDSLGFDKAYWKKPASTVHVEPEAASAPNGTKQAYAISAKPQAGKTVLLLQHAGTSSSRLHYVASIYLRADSPTSLVLSTPLGRSVCRVTTSWQRCVTPATPGNDKTTAQLRLASLHKDKTLDFYAWGAQLEVGNEVSPLEFKNPALLGFTNRFDSAGLFAIRESAGVRLKLMNAAWHMFQSAPLAGVGSSQFQNTLATMQLSDPAVNKRSHAHNLWLHTLATQGLLGGVGLAILFFTPLFILRRFWRQWLPFVVALLLINMVDVIFFSGLVSLSYWLTLAFIWTTNKPEYLRRIAPSHQ